jgi:hypothetical protein
VKQKIRFFKSFFSWQWKKPFQTLK